MGKRGRHRSGARFVALHHWLLRSAAWQALSPNAKAVLLHIWLRHNGSNNGTICYAVREAAEIGLSRSTTARALAELTELGFLRVTRQSSFTLKTKEAREWALTAEPIDGRPPTKDFMRSPSKTKTQSHQRKEQSHPRDRSTKKVHETGVSVSPARPSIPLMTAPRSHQRDTSNLPSWADGNFPEQFRSAVKQRHHPKFGDLAKLERTARARNGSDQEDNYSPPSGD
jgi:hypothetical protein